MPLKVLLIDDQPASVEPVRDELRTSIPDVDCQIADFKTAMASIGQMQPDVVVLDLMESAPEGLVNQGNGIWLQVWSEHFCPLIFYTASEENPDEHNHPLVTLVRKGSGSEEQVRDKIKTYLPHIAALGRVSDEICGALRRALRESKPRIFEIDSAAQENELLTRTIRRRVAASMDDAMVAGEPNIKSWEQYLCPPTITGHLLTGDVLRIVGKDKDNPTSYLVVLTPSCDLVRTKTREPKVETVLLARCAKVDRLLTDLSLTIDGTTKPKKIEDARDKLSRFLTQGYGHSSFPIAGLPGEFPVMAADFRSLEILPLAELVEPSKYDRVASVDAPFRELFVWAYLSAAGRPGMPDRDFGPWADAIIAEIQKSIAPTEAQPAEVAK
jgi:CheY-like chemotaxis protein